MKKNLNINAKGKDYWRSLEELSGTEEFNDFLYREFPKGASELNNNWSRRNFITMMGASLALAGLASCRRPEEKIVPYVKAPEEIIPGQALFYATNMPFGNSSYGLVIETHEGRPTKVEGNKLHPSSQGSAHTFALASMLGLYDPDRSGKVYKGKEEKEWADFVSFWNDKSTEFETGKGEGLAILSESYSSPTIARLRKKFEKKFPKASWVVYDPVSDENIYEGIKIATGESFKPVYDFGKADLILSLDSDFLQNDSESLTATRGFAEGRKMHTENDKMNRLYVVESSLTLTGGMADHRLRIKSSEVSKFTLNLAFELNQQGLNIKGLNGLTNPTILNNSKWSKWLKPLAKDLILSKDRSVVTAGRRQPKEIHALVFAINEALEANNNIVKLYNFDDSDYSTSSDLSELVTKMRSGSVNTLLMLGVNPVYNAPVDLRFYSSLQKVENKIHLNLYRDETAKSSSWHIPMAHYLERWGDVRSVDGTAGLIQPMIEPILGGKSEIELLSLIIDGNESKGYDLVQESWTSLLKGDLFETKWRRVLHDGLLENSQTKPEKKNSNSKSINAALNNLTFKNSEEIEIVFASSASLFDGRFANCGWLMELPDSVTKISWDNVAVISKNTALKYQLQNKDVVVLSFDGKELEAPVWILPGHADNSITVELGYGQKDLGRIADGVGYNAFQLRNSTNPDIGVGLKIFKTGRTMKIANTQDHSSMEGRPLIREGSLEEYKKNPNFAEEMVKHPPLLSLWDDHKYDKGNQWGMSIDLNSCTGCNACTIACQSENNIPVVGKDEVEKGREMHWLRVDRYFTGEVEDAGMVTQPVACHHCENAPCEQVCPVAATTHDEEGLNTMAYNRCIGTRYCSNNCPYKVRRFNFFNYTKDLPELIKMAQNPDVTVRSRGVMEKCTYCVQRINTAKISAKKEDREIRDGEFEVACQQSCPAKAISFGNILDKKSQVYKMKNNSRTYHMLSELNVRPRTSYLAKIRNPNPEMA